MSRGASSRAGTGCFLVAFFPWPVWAFECSPFYGCAPVCLPWSEEPAIGIVSSH